MSPLAQRLVIGTAVLIASGSLGYLIYRAMAAPAESVGDERDRRLSDVSNTVAQSKLSEEDARFLEESAGASDEPAVQRWALVTMAAHLAQDSKMTAETRKVLEDGIVRGLWDTDPRVVISAIGCAEEANLTDRPEVRDRILALCDDGDPKVAERASRSRSARNGG